MEHILLNLHQFIQQKWTPSANCKASFAGKNVIVTGANTGLGFEAAVKFVALDASLVVLGVRDLAKGNRAKSAIEERTGKKDRVEVLFQSRLKSRPPRCGR